MRETFYGVLIFIAVASFIVSAIMWQDIRVIEMTKKCKEMDLLFIDGYCRKG